MSTEDDISIAISEIQVSPKGLAQRLYWSLIPQAQLYMSKNIYEQSFINWVLESQEESG